MATTNENGKDDGIDIHCDGENLSLDCGPDAFAKFREFVAAELSDFPELKIEDVATIEITDKEKLGRNRETPSGFGIGAVVVGGSLLLLVALGVGIYQIAAWLIQLISN